ncbi:hypothetical protein GDO81_024532 [Engystomops pustulosus]|uniref:Uncharacterized protein n=1 Tax=Engystomops pustulosus TaxID=76066 RepID=A0AAV6YJQ3_ENGPU|nr:hypothetical protein GDO81_024532 [Engystomops pustulosus]
MSDRGSPASEEGGFFFVGGSSVSPSHSLSMRSNSRSKSPSDSDKTSYLLERTMTPASPLDFFMVLDPAPYSVSGLRVDLSFFFLLFFLDSSYSVVDVIEAAA